jgi:hypothetical protein
MIFLMGMRKNMRRSGFKNAAALPLKIIEDFETASRYW